MSHVVRVGKTWNDWHHEFSIALQSNSIRHDRPTQRLATIADMTRRLSLFFTLLLFSALSLLSFISPCAAIKFDIPATSHPTTKCIWNYALSDTLVIVTVTSGPIPNSALAGDEQQLDVEIVDASKHNNVYLDKKDIKGETRMAVNTHTHSDLGVCLTNKAKRKSFSGDAGVTVDLDVDIGADAVDYNAIANQESLSGLETEMRKLEAVTQEIIDGLDYLKRREKMMRGTNGEFCDTERMLTCQGYT